MKKIISLFLSFIIVLSSLSEPVLAAEPDILAESAILIEASTGSVIYERNADKKLRPASITKIMTLLLIFDSLKENAISLTDEVTVSEHAASMGGSQVFLEPGEVQTVETMIKCIAISSANDACVAMAEYICSSESAFVDRMNDRAFSLGMTGTHFVNCCGLDADGHLTTARDVAIMSKELITKHPEIHNYTTIWMDTITHVTRRGNIEFTLTNTNKLIKQYEWANGLKTGSTSLAGFCLSATAKKNDIELISVVMGSPTGKTRISDSITLLNYGYGIVNVYKDTEMPDRPLVSVKNGIQDYVLGEYESTFTHMFMSSYDKTQISSRFELCDRLTAPVCEGDEIGRLIYYYGDAELGSVKILASQSIRRANYGDYIKMIWKAWLGKSN